MRAVPLLVTTYLQVLIGENMVDSFPTFKFFRGAAEEEIPVVGADMAQVSTDMPCTVHLDLLSLVGLCLAVPLLVTNYLPTWRR